jgi:hypothetical protein
MTTDEYSRALARQMVQDLFGFLAMAVFLGFGFYMLGAVS